MQPRGDFQLAFGYWIVSHRDQLKKWWVLALLGFISLSLIWTILFFGFFFAQQAGTDTLVSNSAARLSSLRVPAAALPKDLTTSAVSLISRTPESVDLVAFVTNPNREWGAAEVTYHFALGGTALETQTTFVNVGDERPLLRFNIPVVGDNRTASVTIDDVTWKRSAAAALPTPTFAVSDLTITATNVTLAGQTFLTYNLSATVTNRAVFNFLRVNIPLILRSGDRIVAVDELAIDRWPTLSEKQISHTWTYPVSQAGQASLWPQASQFDETNLFQ